MLTCAIFFTKLAIFLWETLFGKCKNLASELISDGNCFSSRIAYQKT
jgi:hypothetical protein